MAMDYECDGCPREYDLNTYRGGSTCNDCGGQIRLKVKTYSVLRKVLNEKKVLDVFPVECNLTYENAIKLKDQKIREILDKIKMELEGEYFVEKD